jgi:hypothetical protein
MFWRAGGLAAVHPGNAGAQIVGTIYAATPPKKAKARSREPIQSTRRCVKVASS